MINATEIDLFIKSIDPKIRRRGKDIYDKQQVFSYDIEIDGISALVESSSGSGFYEVSIKDNQITCYITGECECPYFETEFETCKHIASVAYLWLDITNEETTEINIKPIEKLVVNNIETINSTSTEHIFNIESLDFWVLQNFVKRRYNGYTNNKLEENLDAKSISLSFDKNIKASAKFVSNGYIAVNCNCTATITQKYFCGHIHYLLELTAQKYDKFYFKKFVDHTKQKNAFLKDFGLKVGDKLADKFEFGFSHWGELVLLKKPSNVLKLLDYEAWQDKIATLAPLNFNKPKLTIKKIPDDVVAVGIAVIFGGKFKIPIWVDGVVVVNKKGVETYKRVILNNIDDLAIFGHLDYGILAELQNLTTEGLFAYYKKTLGSYYANAASAFNNIDTERIDNVVKQITITLSNLLKFNHPDLLFFSVEAGLQFNKDTCKPASFTTDLLSTIININKENNFWSVGLQIQANEKKLKLKKEVNRVLPIIKVNDKHYILTEEQITLLKFFAQGNVIVHEQETEAFLQNIIKPLSQKYLVEFDKSINIVKPEKVEPLAMVYLSELNDSFLLVKPKFKYGNFEVDMDGLQTTTGSLENVIYQIDRNKICEEETINYLKELHPRFKTQNSNDYFYLPFADALKGNWFINFFEKLKDQNISLYGLNDLKKFKYNSNKPTVSVKSSSGIDWFDLEIEIHYGDEAVSLSELKKAILSKQEYILLKDGSLGMLPQEWIKKYSPILRMGQLNGDNLKISKFHYTLLDELYDQLDDVAVQEELNQKRQNLGRIDNVKEIALPKNIQATLRDYQLAGYQWMHQLKDLGWGGCLADDMGLGKTLQTLTFLLDCIAKKPKETHLIVCPTSLIYNWESEIQKFTPNLKYHIHFGTDRHLSKEKLIQNNLIITSYGMVRSDIEHLNTFKFGYLILDESQAIKNPGAQITKAVQILKADNRLILSGTPVQNNTFDLYAQMNFLNPGMLGNMEFFKSEFANPIDKYGDKEKSEQLRKMIYPFMLRRTKEQVAKDLPDKTEMVLWCEMDTKQRKVYDYYKNYYRENLMQRIAEDGMGKSSIYILEGLLKLRQICDSPALLKDEKYKNDSVKLAELVRELEDNTCTHKVLVFSQFVEMLKLIKKELDNSNISYAYLDGSTPAAKRKEAVNDFQEDDNLRVFLISLKAGGVGLNLTSADYVYLIDPWWNPAAEQQAIDRTHRIGQTNKVFAYKMICKDSVEEKILQLQQKKKALAVDLIADEAGFVKKLTKDDVAFLFS